MKTDFDQWDRAFRTQNMYEFNRHPNGLLWLKVRAVCRSKQLQRFVSDNHIVLSSSKLADRNVELYETLLHLPEPMTLLDRFLKDKDNEWYDEMGVDEDRLKADLYQVRHYAWGGDQNNSLDKYLVSRYVKTISNYATLTGKQGEIGENAWNYVQASWYNNWTSYLIEALFKRHRRVISAVGEIKSVDFFIDSYPIDLKVTYFPAQYMEEKLKALLGTKEVTWLKRKARALGIVVDNDIKDELQKYILKEKLHDIGRHHVLDELKSARAYIVEEAQRDSVELMKWLYGHQGEMRFGAENRLFLVLVDTADMTASWKMKRAFELIEPTVKAYLDHFSNGDLKEIEFEYKKQQYRTMADAIFVVK